MQLGLTRAVVLWNTICGHLSVFKNEAGYFKTDASTLYAGNMYTGSLAAYRVAPCGDQETFKT